MRANSFCSLVESIECQNESTSWLFKHALNFIIDIDKSTDALIKNLIDATRHLCSINYKSFSINNLSLWSVFLQMQKVQTFHLDVDDITMFIVHALNKHFGTCLIVVTTKLLVVVINLHARPPPGAPNHVVTNCRCWLMASCGIMLK